jgi:hypothetical protein
MKGVGITMKMLNRLLSSILVMIMIVGPFSSVCNAVAAVDDVTGHWAEETITRWQDDHLIIGYLDGTFRPDNTITKAEFITLINRIYGYHEVSEDNYKDIAETDWFANDTAIAKANHYMDWYEETSLNPDAKITRQEVCAIIASILQLASDNEADVFANFIDAETIDDWAKKYISGLVSNGYLIGYDDHTLRVKETITRAEVIVLLDRIMGEFIHESGTYGGDTETVFQTITGNLTVNTDNVILKNMVIEGDLILAAGISDGNVTLTNVTILGRTVLYSGGENCITFTDSSADDDENYISSTTIGYINQSDNIINIPNATKVSDLEDAITVIDDASFDILEGSDGNFITDKGSTYVTEDMIIKVTLSDSTTAEYTLAIKEDGTDEYPFGIWTIEDLLKLGSGLDNWDIDNAYILMVNLDFTDSDSYSDINNMTTYRSFSESVIDEFSGSLDGNNKTISHLTIINSDSSDSTYTGLFSKLADTGSIENLGIRKSDILANNYTGGIVGNNFGTIENCYSTGTISIYKYNVGGIAGLNYGTISNCYSTASIHTKKDYAGGIVGFNYGTIDNCYSDGSVTADNYYAGGIAGGNNNEAIVDEGIINHCYSTGSISSDWFAGGIAGQNCTDAIIKNCYSSGAITGDTYYAGGIAGENDDEGIIDTCYSTGIISSYFNAGGITAENKGTINYSYSTGTIISDKDYTGGITSKNSGTLNQCHYVASPKNNTETALTTTSLTLAFSEEIKGVDDKYITIYTQKNNLVATIEVTDTSQVTIDSDAYTVTIYPTDYFDFDTTYYVLIDDGAFVDQYDNAYLGIASITAWTFTTVEDTE